MNKRYVDIDDVLDLFEISDEDIYAKGTIEDALYDGTLKIYKQLATERLGQWIPVTEKLPDINDHYTSDVCLVYCDNGAYAFAELEENIFGQVGWDCEREDDYHEAIGTVIAWMPLPEPYKEGEQNG